MRIDARLRYQDQSALPTSGARVSAWLQPHHARLQAGSSSSFTASSSFSVSYDGGATKSLSFGTSSTALLIYAAAVLIGIAAIAVVALAVVGMRRRRVMTVRANTESIELDLIMRESSASSSKA